jgi:hypothetical protein
LFFIVGPDQRLPGAEVKGLMKAGPIPTLLLIDLFLLALWGLLDLLDLHSVTFSFS